MALKPIEAVKFNAINQTVAGLKAANLPAETILSVVSAQIADFEASTTYRVTLEQEALPDGSFLSLIDTRKDFIRARKSGEAFKVLRAKIFGIPVDVKVAKDGEFSHTNAQVAATLIELAARVLALPKEVKDAGNYDFKGDVESPDDADGDDAGQVSGGVVPGVAAVVLGASDIGLAISAPAIAPAPAPVVAEEEKEEELSDDVVEHFEGEEEEEEGEPVDLGQF
jgi:hypothetical protein